MMFSNLIASVDKHATDIYTVYEKGLKTKISKLYKPKPIQSWKFDDNWYDRVSYGISF